MSKDNHAPINKAAEISAELSHPDKLSLDRVMDIVEGQQKSMSPQQYGDFLRKVNTSLGHELPGLSIVGLDTRHGAPRLELMDALGKTVTFGRDQEKNMESMIAHRPKVTDKGHGAYEVRTESGVVIKLQDKADGSRTEVSEGPRPIDNFVLQSDKDGNERVQYKDGFGRETTYDKKGAPHVRVWQNSVGGKDTPKVAPAIEAEPPRPGAN